MPLWFSLSLSFALAWFLVPVLAVLALPGVPWQHRRKAAVSFLSAFPRGILVVPVALLAPFVVPIALLFTKRSDDRLPRLFRWWDNDVSINGDAALTWSTNPATGYDEPDRVPDEDTPAVRALCYYAKGHHPRSFWARYVWLGLRNRGSYLAAQLGVKSDLPAVVQCWGNTDAGRSMEGCGLMANGGAYQLIASQKIGKLCARVNYGFKVNHHYMGRARLPVVNVTISLLSWKGVDNDATPAAKV